MDSAQQSPALSDKSNRAEYQNGQGHDIEIRVRLALGKNPMETGTPVVNREFSLSELAGLLTKHQGSAEKNGPYFCAPMAKSQRNGENALPWQLFALDFDGKEGDTPDPEVSKAFFSDC